MIIRHAVIQDFEDVIRLMRDVVAALRGHGIDQWDEQYPDPDDLKQDIAQQTLYVAVDDTTIAGIIALDTCLPKEYEQVAWQYPGSALTVHRLMVHPEYLRRGIARLLMEHTERHAARLGCPVIRLDAYLHNPAALRLYQRLGFRTAGQVTFRRRPFVCYEKSLEVAAGNMNPPLIAGGRVWKPVTPATLNIHALLQHVRERGITWVPMSFGIQGELHELSCIEGTVLHTSPPWLHEPELLQHMTKRLRRWHDATLGFRPPSPHWLIPTDGVHEVICHNDFAHYNWVFQGRRFLGLIDFDTCAPGSRLWDLSYTAYRLVPLVSDQTDEATMRQRLQSLLTAYADGSREYQYTPERLSYVLHHRLNALADWSEQHAHDSGNLELTTHARMYRDHADWVAAHVG